MMFNNAAEALAHLEKLGMFSIDLGLDRMERALDALGLRDAFCPTVQITGTNGKGSTSTFLYSIAQAQGLRSGVYNSPHFVSPSERIRFCGHYMDEGLWPACMEKALEAEPHLTYFELVTAVALQAYREARVEVLFLEAGLGARYDATTAFPADMACFCPIALDHLNVLGDTLEKIAEDKSYAIRKGMTAAVTAPQAPEVMAVLRARADAEGVPLYTFEDSARFGAVLSDEAMLGLEGPHQRCNARLALLAWKVLCAEKQLPCDEAAVRRGLAEAFIPGRFQREAARGGMPALILDGAHNAHGMGSLISSLKACGAVPETVIFSCLGDKHPEEIIPLLDAALPQAEIIIPKISDNPRAAEPADLAAMFAHSERCRCVADLAEAFGAAREKGGEGPLLVCGSLYLLGEFYTMFPQYLERAAVK